MNTPSLIEDIFLTALEKGSREERAAYLEAACKDNPDLRRRVERLLEAHPKAGGFLEPPARPAGGETGAFVPAGGTTAAPANAIEHAGVVIAGRYKLIEPIGEGGMGSVWMAQQQEPVKRLVAVKLIKAGMDSKAVLARFEAERQALALMDHPNIAKVLDAGATPDGRPFFVMELVKGIPITTFCDGRKLTPRERLELFVPVCQAIQHAHQKGVIHRDIKPSNVLVALYDDKPVPKVIDFGVAKAAGQPLTERTLATGFGAVVGTPEYMSPEQASFNNLDIDTRSDVYALGVLLYELLAGSPPFARKELEKAGLLEILRVVREVEPPRPSTRLSTAEALPTLSANRGTEPARLTRLVRGELDWIVMKALEKDRSRRYDSATGFAADVHRYLAGEPVQAVPPSTWYRVRKLVRKNRALLTSATAFAALLIVAAAVSSWLAVQAKRSEAFAVEKRNEAEANANRADRNAGIAMGALFEADNARQTAEMSAASLQVDLDLSELRTDSRVGTLHLVRTIQMLAVDQTGHRIDAPPGLEATRTIPAESPSSQPNKLFAEMRGIFQDKAVELGARQNALREFVTLAVLAAGQDYTPLLPPITHGGRAVVQFHLSADGRTLLTRADDLTARLWDVRTGRQIAVLREGGERVINCGFSPDGRTAFTDDESDTVRFWDSPGGAFRARTEPRPYRIPKALYLSRTTIASNNRLLKMLVVAEKDDPDDFGATLNYAISPVELWDTKTGRLVARLNGPDRNAGAYRFAGGGRWVTTVAVQRAADQSAAVLVFSAHDGRLIARLDHGKDDDLQTICANERLLATVTTGRGSRSSEQSIRLWDTESWRERSATRHVIRGPGDRDGELEFSTDREFGISLFGGGFIGTGRYMSVYRYDTVEPIATCSLGYSPGRPFAPFNRAGDPANNRVGWENGWVLDTRTWQRLQPPKGRKYHPELARFAPDGRFFSDLASRVLIDTRTEKQLPASAVSYVPDVGWVSAANSYGIEIGIIPKAGVNVPADMLELWTEVAVRGELGPDGEFVKWNEPTWETKRQQLAAMPVPNANFPFPGYVATDKLHWLRQEYEGAAEADKPRLAKQLLDRAEAAGDKAEAVRWRTVLAPKAKAPPPK